MADKPLSLSVEVEEIWISNKIKFASVNARLTKTAIYDNEVLEEKMLKSNLPIASEANHLTVFHAWLLKNLLQSKFSLTLLKFLITVLDTD